MPTVTPGILQFLHHAPPDSLLALIGMYRADQRTDKIDLGVGVYRDRFGETPVMKAIKFAEGQLLSEQTTKSYLGADGDVIFTQRLGEHVFAQDLALLQSMSGLQTPGGTGALRLAAELLARANPNATVWIGDPSWPNHAPIFREAGLRVRTHRFYDPGSSELQYEEMMWDLKEAARGDALLLHGCCHNPTGEGFSPDQSAQVISFAAAQGLVPIIDLAYQGLGEGWHEDAAFTCAFLKAAPEALVAYSCDKNFGLYRERVGALWVKAGSSDLLDRARSNCLSLARSMWSMPPDHGAALVRLVLETPALQASWSQELDVMREAMLSVSSDIRN